MKKWTMLLMTVIAGGLLSACASGSAASDNSWENVQEKEKLTVATSGTLFPASYYNDDNELIGYDVDVIKEAAKRLGLSVEFKEYNVDGQISSVTRGESDLAANDYTLTKEKEKNFILSEPIKYSFDSLIVRKKDDSGISSLEDLKGKKAAGEPNTSYMKIAEKYGAKLVTYDNATNDQYLTDVANGRTDVILNDYYLQKMSVEALPEIPVKILDDVYFNANHSGFLFSKKNEQLKEKIDEKLQEMKEDGTLKELAEKYFGENVSVQPKQKVEETVSAD